MYCKFCGGPLTPESSTCASCGAKIDKSDYGQTFFEADDLLAWKEISSEPDSVVAHKSGFQYGSSCPEECPDDISVADDTGSCYSANDYTSSVDKKRLTFLKVFCIVSVIIIIALSATIVYISRLGSNEASDESIIVGENIENTDNANDSNTTETTETEEGTEADSSEKNDDQTLPAPPAPDSETPRASIPDMLVIEGIKIRVNNANINYNSEGRMLNNRLFVSAEPVLKHIGYNTVTTSDDGSVIFKKRTGEEIELKDHERSFSVKAADGTIKQYDMIYPCFNIETIFVHSGSFFDKLGYDVIYDKDTKVLSLESK